MQEEALAGGNMGPVARVGDTVRRRSGPWTPTIHDLLRHVRARGVAEVPEPLGLDAAGREVVSFVAGEVPSEVPAWVLDVAVLRDAARLLRRYHDATVDFPREGRIWQLPAHAPDEVICHNDFAPYNLVFRDHRLAGVIDFDTASPGPRVWDLAYLAYRLVPMTSPDSPEAVALSERVRAARLAGLCAAYGGDLDAAAVLAVVPGRLDELAAFTQARADDGGPAELRDHVVLYRNDAAHVRRLQGLV